MLGGNHYNWKLVFLKSLFCSNRMHKTFVICSLLIHIFSIWRLGKASGSNCLFERGWNNNHLILFYLNHFETFSSFTFILAKSVSVFSWGRNRLVLSLKRRCCILENGFIFFFMWLLPLDTGRELNLRRSN